MLDNRPVFLKQWVDGMEFSKDEFDTLPIWVRLPDLPIKYWGKDCLHKIASLIGPVVRVDQATSNRDKLGYARVLVEMKIESDFPETIVFLNEHGVRYKQEIQFEWKPTKCSGCGMLGHEEVNCRKKDGLQKKKRRPGRKAPPGKGTQEPEGVQQPAQVDVAPTVMNQESHFVEDPVVNWIVGGARDSGRRTHTPIANRFQSLQDAEENDIVVGQVHCSSPRGMVQDQLGHG